VQALLERIGTLLQLTWQYGEITGAAPTGAAATALAQRSRRHLDDLYQLGRIGHVRGIEAKLRELEIEDPANEPVASRLRTLVVNFDLKRYMNALEAMRADS